MEANTQPPLTLEQKQRIQANREKALGILAAKRELAARQRTETRGNAGEVGLNEAFKRRRMESAMQASTDILINASSCWSESGSQVGAGASTQSDLSNAQGQQQTIQEEVESVATWRDEDLLKVLQRFFPRVRAGAAAGEHGLRSFQRQALIRWSRNEDCIILSGTGSGKSLCFQLPSLLYAQQQGCEEGHPYSPTVVVSPLISLMRDQTMALQTAGVPACFLGSAQKDKTIEERVAKGEFAIVYVCPETIVRLAGTGWLTELHRTRGICLLAIDEAHCVSKWGHEFRPSYLCLSTLRQCLTAVSKRPAPPMMALTATATLKVRMDIQHSLSLRAPVGHIICSFHRSNLRLAVCHSTCRADSYLRDLAQIYGLHTPAVGALGEGQAVDGYFAGKGEAELDATNDESDDDDLMMIDAEGCHQQRRFDHTAEPEERVDALAEVDLQQTLLLPAPGSREPGDPKKVPTILYMPTRAEVEEMAQFLQRHGVEAAAYHAKLPKEQLVAAHLGFLEGSVHTVVATVAFGMGIDKPDVRRVVHYGLPQSLEAYHQALAMRRDQPLSSGCSSVTPTEKCIFGRNGLTKGSGEGGDGGLWEAGGWAEQGGTARRQPALCSAILRRRCLAATLLEYFGEALPGPSWRCESCDNCSGSAVMLEVTLEAGMLLAAVEYLADRRAAEAGTTGKAPGWNGRNGSQLRSVVRALTDGARKQGGKGGAGWGHGRGKGKGRHADRLQMEKDVAEVAKVAGHAAAAIRAQQPSTGGSAGARGTMAQQHAGGPGSHRSSYWWRGFVRILMQQKLVEPALQPLQQGFVSDRLVLLPNSQLTVNGRQWLAQHLRPEGHQRTAPPSIYIAEERDMQRPISPPRNNPWSNPIWRMRKIAEIQRGRKERGRKERRRKY
ncbi:hypothetical protein CYMTET_9825 [Cymbomonas tetramitiformis]|uniref:DNA 3'-5' helicase n=1 Tax=Cymbomonas tetramitiformis TaxID=36881 RepID=A0AAE0LEM4_9CHLO|nr:hypothetical protein CYMTET_9825 [Cymbomonas tetramitiformis]